MDASKPPLRRWRWQFSLRALLLLMLVVASFLAGRLSPQRELEQARQAAVEAQLAAERALRAEIEARYAMAMAKEQSRLAELQAAQASEP